MSSNTLDVALKRWEDTRDLLAGAMRDYLDSCIYLNDTLGLRNRHTSTMSIISRIESKLDLQYEMIRQLTQSTSTLVQTRNRFTSSILVLPEEVLSQIFLYAVYDPENKDLPMEKYLSAVYRNLYNLFGVCSDWRNVALAQPMLWQVLPVTERHIKTTTIDLCINRSRGRGLNLALRWSPSWSTRNIPARALEILKQDAFRLRTINLQVAYPEQVTLIVKCLLESGVSDQFSGLSMRCTQPRNRTSLRRSPYVIEPTWSLHREFEALVNSLSTLRLDRVQLKWQITTFSNQLVSLVVHKIKLGESGLLIDSFASAICAARELRDIQIFAVTGSRNAVSIDQEYTIPRIFPRIVLSKLRSLVLQGLSFSVLESLLMTIAPGSYHTTVELTRNTTRDVFSNTTTKTIEMVNLAELFKLVKIDKLLLTDAIWANDSWLAESNLYSLLESLQELKELVIHGCAFDSFFCNDVFVSQSMHEERSQGDILSLEVLTLTRSTISDEDGFKRLFTSILPQKLILGGHTQVGEVKEEVKEGSAIAEWLNSNLSVVCFVVPDYSPRELEEMAREWLLW